MRSSSRRCACCPAGRAARGLRRLARAAPRGRVAMRGGIDQGRWRGRGDDGAGRMATGQCSGWRSRSLSSALRARVTRRPLSAAAYSARRSRTSARDRRSRLARIQISLHCQRRSSESFASSHGSQGWPARLGISRRGWIVIGHRPGRQRGRPDRLAQAPGAARASMAPGRSRRVGRPRWHPSSSWKGGAWPAAQNRAPAAATSGNIRPASRQPFRILDSVQKSVQQGHEKRGYVRT